MEFMRCENRQETECGKSTSQRSSGSIGENMGERDRLEQSIIAYMYEDAIVKSVSLYGNLRITNKAYMLLCYS